MLTPGRVDCPAAGQLAGSGGGGGGGCFLPLKWCCADFVFLCFGMRPAAVRQQLCFLGRGCWLRSLPIGICSRQGSCFQSRATRAGRWQTWCCTLPKQCLRGVKLSMIAQPRANRVGV